MNLGYIKIYDLPLLREEIRKLYKTKNHILVFSGTEEAIYLAMRACALLKAEEKVIVMTPCYQSLKEVLKAIEAKVIEFKLDWKNDTWSFNLEKFE